MRSSCLVFLISIVFSISGCQKRPDAPVIEKYSGLKIELPPAEMDAVQATIFKTNVSEELILDLTPRFGLLSQKMKGQDVDLRDLFQSNIRHLGLADFDIVQAVESETTDQNHLVAHASWPLESAETELAIAEFWAPLLNAENGFQFEDVQFGVLKGELLENANVFRMKTIVEGRFQDSQQRVYGFSGKQTLEWHASGDQWKIAAWHQDQMDVTFAPRALFEDVTDRAFNKTVGKILARSQHEELLMDRSKDPDYLRDKTATLAYFSDWHSAYQYGSVSVVDLDQDQWDDLFVLDRWGESVLLRNKGDGTFEDVSKSCGLRLTKSYANCAVFADFDNDGDSDALIGRTVTQSLYYRNDGGEFVRDEEVNKELADLRFVTCGSAIDINRDGLLDVYLSTYCSIGGKEYGWIKYATSTEYRDDLRDKVQNCHSFLDRRGPPNFVMLNHDGKLKKASIGEELMQWRNSFQSVWTDIDGDGDPDLYLCNDFAPDVFLRNDTERGSFDLKFVDITEEVFRNRIMGFGMGASFGDYDSNGTLDLYVSNMYSKAGRRIIDKFDGNVNQHMVVSAQGNYLFKRNGKHLDQVAGLTDDKQQVAKVGWSFGGQLADINNDSKLDVYVPSGLFTPPQEIDSQSDL